MAREWTDEEVQAEIAEAVKMVAADREKAEYARLHGIYGAPDNPEDKGDGKTPPPKKEPKEGDPPATKKKSLWWGETTDE